jgi:hypothetical protein
MEIHPWTFFQCSLITYEKAFFNQAEIGIVPSSTFIERKIMSTKTSIKRIALVAAAALAIGGFSAVSANAATNTYLYVYTADGVTAGAGTLSAGNGVAGVANSVVVALTNTASKDSYVSVTGGTISSADSTTAVVATDGKSVTRAFAYTGVVKLTVPTPTTGTITLNLYTGTGGIYGTTAAETVVITVNAAASSGVYSAATSTAYLVAGDTSTATSTTDAAGASNVATYAGNESATATIVVSYLDANSAAVLGDTLTGTITSGPGYLNATRAPGTSGTVAGSVADTSTAKYNTATKTGSEQGSSQVGTVSQGAMANPAGLVVFKVWASGQTGVTTVTIKNTAGTVVATKTVTFTGTTPASLTTTVDQAFVSADAAGKPTQPTSAPIKILVKDASGNPIVSTAVALTVTSSDTTIISGASVTGTTDASGYIYETPTVIAGKYGKVTLTATYSTALSTTAVVTAASPVAATLTITATPSLNQGEKATFTLTAKDANGYALPDGTYAPGSFVASYSGSAQAYAADPAFTDTVTLSAGVATRTAYLPTVGSYIGTWTLAGTTAATASTNLAKTLTTTALTTTTSVGGSSDAALALDAANAATDAANNAYDEAQNATQAASDALAAVKALAVQVKALIALVTKIKNKVGA